MKAYNESVASCMMHEFIFSAPFASVLGHRYSYRAVLMTGGALCSAALFLAAFAPNFTFIMSTFGVLTGTPMAYFNTLNIIYIYIYINSMEKIYFESQFSLKAYSRFT